MNTPNLTIQELVPLIQEWAKEREIYEQLTPFDELLKTHEEVGELIKACYDNDKPAIQDAIGDVIVTLINYCYMERIDVLEQINDVLNFERKRADSKVVLALNIQDSLNRLMCANFRLIGIGGETPFLYFYEIITIIGYLDDIAFLENTTLEECLNIAYNEIKNRKGRIINRKFIKDKQDE
nr:MAG TPA: NTP-PPase-like protein [Caudoviricetes sp.]